MHADAQAQAVRLGAQRVLDGNDATQRLHRAREGGEKAVAGGLEQPTPMRGGKWLDNFCTQGAYASQRGRFICTHHGRVADNIGCQNAGQTTTRLVHAYPPMQRAVVRSLSRFSPPGE
jgi:hypothetical protein